MSQELYNFISLDALALLTALFSALSCALLGNFLVLRRQSLMGDAISHAVLPGIVLAFLFTSSRAGLTVFWGAAISGILVVILIELVRRLGRLDADAAMGVVFSIFFALGVVLIEQAAARSVDLDAECLLHGQLETIFWYPQRDLSLWNMQTLLEVPNEVWASLAVLVLSLLFVAFFYKELKLVSFDAELCSALGFNSALLNQALVVFVALAVVASFKSVGSILVIAMLICPAASARLLTDKLRTQLGLSLLIAMLGTLGGYFAAAFGPQLLGFSNSVNAAGSMATVSGLLLFTCVLFAPSYGVLGMLRRKIMLWLRVLSEDLLGMLYRHEELSGDAALPRALLKASFGRPLLANLLLSALKWRNLIYFPANSVALTASGREQAKDLVRSHRLWESFLVKELGLRQDHVHQSAAHLEHFTEEKLQVELEKTQGFPQSDPHGKEIPR